MACLVVVLACVWLHVVMTFAMPVMVVLQLVFKQFFLGVLAVLRSLGRAKRYYDGKPPPAGLLGPKGSGTPPKTFWQSCKRGRTREGVTTYPRLLIQLGDDFVVCRGGPTSERATRHGMGWNFEEVEAAESTTLRNSLMRDPNRLIHLNRSPATAPSEGGPYVAQSWAYMQLEPDQVVEVQGMRQPLSACQCLRRGGGSCAKRLCCVCRLLWAGCSWAWGGDARPMPPRTWPSWTETP